MKVLRGDKRNNTEVQQTSHVFRIALLAGMCPTSLFLRSLVAGSAPSPGPPPMPRAHADAEQDGTHQVFYVNCTQSQYRFETPYKANPLPENPDATSSSGAPRQNP